MLLLCFNSVDETKAMYRRNERKQYAWLATLGTGLPFFAMVLAASYVPLRWFVGSSGNRTSLILVMSIAVAVTSIPVIFRIFLDLTILHDRFARLGLGGAGLQGIWLWAGPAVATARA